MLIVIICVYALLLYVHYYYTYKRIIDHLTQICSFDKATLHLSNIVMFKKSLANNNNNIFICIKICLLNRREMSRNKN